MGDVRDKIGRREVSRIAIMQSCKFFVKSNNFRRFASTWCPAYTMLLYTGIPMIEIKRFFRWRF